MHLLADTALDLQSLTNGTSGVALHDAAIPVSELSGVQELLAYDEGRILCLDVVHVAQPSWTN